MTRSNAWKGGFFLLEVVMSDNQGRGMYQKIIDRQVITQIIYDKEGNLVHIEAEPIVK